MMTREQALEELRFLRFLEKEWGELTFLSLMPVIGPTIMEIRQVLLQPAA